MSTRLACVLATSWIVALLMVGGCASSGRKIQSDFVRSIKVGATTKHGVIALFGDTQERQVAGRTDAWVYAYAKSGGFGSSSQRLELGFENDVVVTCRFDTFQLDHSGRPQSSASVPCDQLRPSRRRRATRHRAGKGGSPTSRTRTWGYTGKKLAYAARESTLAVDAAERRGH